MSLTAAVPRVSQGPPLRCTGAVAGDAGPVVGAPRYRARMIQVGLTGGIGSGKSTVARLLAERGAVVVDADVLARDAVAPGTPGFAAVLERFGAGVITPDGSLDRAALGRLVFADEEARRDLEAVVHPYVGRRTSELVAAAGAGAVVVHDVPLLVEKRLRAGYDVVVVVDASDDTRVARLAATRGMSEEDAWAVMAAQSSRAERLATADVLLDNDGDLEHLERQVDRLWADLRDRLSPA